jgi:hypothetical protein
LAALSLAYVIDGATRMHRAGDAPVTTVTRTLGDTTLHIPAIWLVDQGQQAGGFSKQVDLALNLPLGPKDALRRVDVSLTLRSRVRPSAALLDGVYLHQFQPEQIQGPPGLVGKPMAPTAGYADETVWYDPLTPSPFVAKCDAPIVAGTPGRCLRAVYLGSGIAAIYGFADDMLVNWKKLDAAMHPILVEIGAL